MFTTAMFPRFCFLLVCAAVVCICLAGHLAADEAAATDYVIEGSRPDAVASDQQADPAEDAAMQLLRERGSIVEQRRDLRGWQQLPPRPAAGQPRLLARPEYQPVTAFEPARPRDMRVEKLREAAWQLDTTAHELEKLDLYEQADALRETANRLRHDARHLKQKRPTNAP